MALAVPLPAAVRAARANDLEPYAYLRRLFAELSRARTAEDFEVLLPFSSLFGKARRCRDFERRRGGLACLCIRDRRIRVRPYRPLQ